MNKVSGKQACELAVRSIEEQLRVLPVAIAAIMQMPKSGGSGTLPLPRKGRSSGAEDGPQPFLLELGQAGTDGLPAGILRVLVSNALLSVGILLQEQDLSTSRTPQMQFLGHVCSAILQGNVFALKPGYQPTAHFDGLVIAECLNGQALFADNPAEGFMGFGDAFALLHWLAHYLGGEPHQFTGGDAG